MPHTPRKRLLRSLQFVQVLTRAAAAKLASVPACFTQQSVNTAWDPTLDEVEELIDGLAEAGKGVAQKASECDCTVSLDC